MRQKTLAIISIIAVLSGCELSREVAARSYRLITSLHAAPVDGRELPFGIESVCTRGSLSWLVPVGGNDIVLIDTGFDDQARAIKLKVGSRKIKAILLTHAHVDHAAGTQSIDAPVYVGRADAPALRGEAIFSALWPRLAQAFLGIPITKGPIHPVDDGFVYAVDGSNTERGFLAIATPGHTEGSTSWLYRGILFGGDAVEIPAADAIYPAPLGFTQDISAAYDSLRRLRDHHIEFLADAHIGVLKNPEAALRRALERQHNDELFDYPFGEPRGCADDPPDT